MADSVGAAATTAPSVTPPAPSTKPPIESAPPQFTFSGRPGSPFNIDGIGFGDVPGVVTVGNRVVVTTRWIDRSIKGVLPKDVKAGPVVVQTDTNTQTGVFNG